MAIIKCKACGNDFSDKVGACPHCGAKVKSSTVLQVLGGFVALVIIGAIISPHTPLTMGSSMQVLMHR